MAKIVTSIPQTEITSKVFTIKDLISVLPKTLTYEVNIWVGGRLARDGKTADNYVHFLIESSTEATVEMCNYFNALVEPLGLCATVLNSWKDQYIIAMRIYNSGRLILDEEGRYTEFPEPVGSRTEILASEILERLPDEIPFTETIWLTGSLVKHGWSCKDADIIIGEPTDSDGEVKFNNTFDAKTLRGIKAFLRGILGCPVDVGTYIMEEREPVYLYRLYSRGKRCQPQT